ncbi:unnamed protein product [Rotaria sordida]|uniref:Uncharacterized protein n=1 Tax=Rotaria sordida TaxID=392033 RepID=A0A814UDX9_9BILA|nr:unnamed protein product [Rotaria sordida]
MASTHYDDAKRFTSRESIGASEEYSKPVYELEPDPSAKQLSAVTPHPFSRSIEGMTPHEVVPATRRIVVVRNTTDPQDEQGKSIDTSVSSQPKSLEFSPRITDGRTSVYIIRRKIPPEDEKNPTSYYPPVEGSVQNSSTPLEYIHTPSPNPYSLGSRTLSPYHSPTKDPSQALVPSQKALISSTSYRSTSPQQLSKGIRRNSPSTNQTDTDWNGEHAKITTGEE